MNDVSTSKTPAWVILAAVTIGGIFYLAAQSVPVQSETAASPTVTVSGEGKITTPPDIASVSFGVQTGTRHTAKEAMTMLSKQMNAVFDAVKKTGVATKDISTEQFNLSPVYDWSSSRQVIIGYQASQTLSAKVRDLDNVANVLSAATDAGANQAGSVVFTIDDPNAVQAQARQKAIVDATEKARVLAKQLGLRLGRITSFSENGGGYNPPVPMMARNEMAMDAGKSLPMPPGEQDVNISVSITYELY